MSKPLHQSKGEESCTRSRGQAVLSYKGSLMAKVSWSRPWQLWDLSALTSGPQRASRPQGRPSGIRPLCGMHQNAGPSALAHLPAAPYTAP